MYFTGAEYRSYLGFCYYYGKGLFRRVLLRL